MDDTGMNNSITANDAWINLGIPAAATALTATTVGLLMGSKLSFVLGLIVGAAASGAATHRYKRQITAKAVQVHEEYREVKEMATKMQFAMQEMKKHGSDGRQSVFREEESDGDKLLVEMSGNQYDRETFGQYSQSSIPVRDQLERNDDFLMEEMGEEEGQGSRDWSINGLRNMASEAKSAAIMVAATKPNVALGLSVWAGYTVALTAFVVGHFALTRLVAFGSGVTAGLLIGAAGALGAQHLLSTQGGRGQESK